MRLVGTGLLLSRIDPATMASELNDPKRGGGLVENLKAVEGLLGSLRGGGGMRWKIIV